jgi:hypothetical protein
MRCDRFGGKRYSKRKRCVSMRETSGGFFRRECESTAHMQSVGDEIHIPQIKSSIRKQRN